MATKTKKKSSKKRTPAQIAATKRMLAGLARSKGKKSKKTKTTSKKAKAKPAAKKAKKAPSNNGAGTGFTTRTLATGSRFAGWKSNKPGDMREIKLPENQRIVVRGKRAVIITTGK